MISQAKQKKRSIINILDISGRPLRGLIAQSKEITANIRYAAKERIIQLRGTSFLTKKNRHNVISAHIA